MARLIGLSRENNSPRRALKDDGVESEGVKRTIFECPYPDCSCVFFSEKDQGIHIKTVHRGETLKPMEK